MATRKENMNPETTNPEFNGVPVNEDQPAPEIPALTVRIYPARNLRNPNSKFRGEASVNIGGLFAVKGFRIFDSDKGLFVKNPEQTYVKDGTQLNRDVFFPVTKEARAALNDQILKSYEVTMAHEARQGEAPAEEDAPVLGDDDLPFEYPAPGDEEAPAYGGMDMSM